MSAESTTVPPPMPKKPKVIVVERPGPETEPPPPPQNQVIHSVDGIEEYDNQLPRWWLYTLYVATAFGGLYWYTYQVGHFADLPLAAYEAEKDKAALAAAAKDPTGGAMKPEALVALSHDTATVALGKEVFTSACVACHRADGGGNVGPNLTDEFWLHGGAPDQIYKTVGNGVLEKGMPAWKPQLGIRKVQAVTAYVLTLHNTNVPGGKAPQGERDVVETKP